MFINQVREQLKNMSENEKDEWILDRARLVSESEQSGFLATLTGKKKLEDIPNLQQIDVFCRKVGEGGLEFQVIDSPDTDKPCMDHDLFTLAEEITEVKSVLEEQFLIDTCSREKRALQEKLERRQELFQDLREKSIGSTKNNVPQEQNVSVLKVSWGQICELLKWLSYEPYIDDQPEIDEIWKICSALAKRGQLVQEDWELRKEILRSIIENEYYDYYGCYDPMMELAEKLYTTPKEHFEVAHIMEQYKGFEEQAAQIYRQFGQEDKYVSYLEMHLDKKKENYLALLQYDQEHGNRERAMRTARLALEKCKDDLTDFFVFLLREAKAEGDEAEYKKLFSSAKRRRNVQLGVIEEALRQFRVE